MFTEKDAKEAIEKLAELKGVGKARLIEKMLRLETGHFKSKQYKLSGSAGMEAGNWQGLKPETYTTFTMNDNHLKGDKQLRTFIKWNNVFDFCLYLSDYIDRHGGNYARWNTTDPVRQEKYREKLRGIDCKFI